MCIEISSVVLTVRRDADDVSAHAVDAWPPADEPTVALASILCYFRQHSASYCNVLDFSSLAKGGLFCPQNSSLFCSISVTYALI